MAFVALPCACADFDLSRADEETTVRSPTIDSFRDWDIPLVRALVESLLESWRNILANQGEWNIVEAALGRPLSLILTCCRDETDKTVFAIGVALNSDTVSGREIFQTRDTLTGSC